MKKTILAALAALTFVSPVSALELPEGITCTDLFWETKGRVNPTELSDYQKCVIDTNWPEKTSGTIGDLFWVRIDGEFYSTSFRLLRSSFSSIEEAQAAFETKILIEREGQ